MTLYNSLSEFDQLKVMSDVERHFDWDQVYEMRVDLKAGKICAFCFEEKDLCTCKEDEE